MTKITLFLEDYLRIRDCIEKPREDKLKIAKTEFVWAYYPDKRLEELERIASSGLSLFMQKNGFAVEYKGITNSDAIATLHNHPEGFMIPTLTDISTFLKAVYRNKNLKYDLIASTVKGKVLGFYVLNYKGERKDSKRLLSKVDSDFTKCCVKRHKEMEKYPSKFTQFYARHNIFTNEEYIDLSLHAMKSSLLENYPIAMQGYKFK